MYEWLIAFIAIACFIVGWVVGRLVLLWFVVNGPETRQAIVAEWVKRGFYTPQRPSSRPAHTKPVFYEESGQVTKGAWDKLR